MTTTARGIERWVPGLRVARRYQRSWLPKDVTAGLVLTALLVPAGMGYATAAGLPPITGLYATIIPLLAYAIFGPSRILVLGPDSSLAPLIAASVVPLAGNDPETAVRLAGVLSILAGLMCVVAGLARFGFITDVLSKPVRYGYMNGIALTVIVSQLPKLLGFSVDGSGLVGQTVDVAQGIVDGATNPTALAIGAAGIAVILACKRWMPRVPGRAALRRRRDRAGVGASTSPSGAISRWSARSRGGCRPRPSRARRGTRSVSSRSAPSASRWCRSPTPACCPARSPSATTRTSTPIRR